MAVKRQGNWLGQQRVDIPHLRSIESGVAGDFDSLAGKATAGGQALVVAGFTLSNITPGLAATGILLNVASGILLASTASESGTIFTVAAGTPAETFLSTNAKLSGSFAPSTTNYIGVDLLRAADATTTDLVRFLSTAPTAEEYTQTVPLARTLDYSIVISTTDFNTNTNLVPIAKVVTDASNNIVSVTDCRQMMHRLGTGGTTPVPRGPYSWTDTNRNEGASADIFAGGDKNIASQWEWGRAVMGRLWELGGGEYWYSPSADRNVRCVGDPGSYFIGGENFEWDGTNLHWQGVRFVFANSTGWYNNVTAVTLDTPGLTDLANPGDCIYVDVDRTSNATVSAVKGNLATLTMPTIPGSRFVLAWRPFAGAYIFTILGGPNPVGGAGGAHANAGGIYGIVTLTANAGEDAVVPGATAAGLVVGTGISRKDNSPIGLGAGAVSIGTNASFDTSVVIGNSSGSNSYYGTMAGAASAHYFYDAGTVGAGPSIILTAAAKTGTTQYLMEMVSAYGTVLQVRADGAVISGSVYATALQANANGAETTGNGSGYGLLGTGGATNGSIGVYGTSGAVNGKGVYGLGTGTGTGVSGVGGSAGIGVEGLGQGAGSGGEFTAGATGIGLKATSVSTALAILALGNGASAPTVVAGTAIGAKGSASGAGVHGEGGSSGASVGAGVTGVGGVGTATGRGGTGVSGAGGDSAGAGGFGGGHGGDFTGGAGTSGPGGVGVKGTGNAVGNTTGVWGVGGGTGIGVQGDGGTNGIGVKGAGNGSGSGGEFTGGATGYGIILTGNATKAALRLVGGAYGAGAGPSSPLAGDIIFNTSDSHFYGYDGAAWKQLDN